MENNRRKTFLAVFQFSGKTHSGIGNRVVWLKNSTPTLNDIRATEKAIAEQMDVESVAIVNMVLLGD